jgi:hypothetical protein
METMRYEEFMRRIRTSDPFHFARYGDGEFYAMFGKKGSNIDGHAYQLPGLATDLKRTLLEPKPYLYGLQPLAASKPKLMKQVECLVGCGFPWVDADILHDASERGTFISFLDVLRETPCLFIGPPHLRALKVHPDTIFIDIPPRNCYAMDRKALADRIRSSTARMVIFCAGFLSNVMIWQLHEDMKHAWMIDAGSVFDPYCGVNSRTYHSRVNTSLYQ